MALKDFDYKGFLLQKGEWVGLFMAVGIMVVLLVLGPVLMGLGSTGAKSADAKAKDIKDLSARGRSALSTAPPKEIGFSPRDLDKAQSIEPVDPHLYTVAKLPFMSLGAEEIKWRKPAVLSPDEFDATFVHLQVPSYDFSRDFKTMYFRVAKGGTADNQPKMDKSQSARLSGRFGPKAGGTMPSMMKAQPGQRFPPGAGTVTPGMGMPGPSSAPGSGDTGPQYDLVPYDLDKVDKATGEPAQVIIPYRMVVVSAAFPFRQQLETIKAALRYPTVADMLNDRDKDPVIEFTGMNVKRRVLSLDGKVQSDWADLDINNRYKMMHFLAVDRAPEDPDQVAYGIIENQVPTKLVQRLPNGFTDTPYPPKPTLTLLDEALEAQKKIIQDANPLAAPPKSRFSRDEFDPDQPDESGTATPGMGTPGTMSPGGSSSRGTMSPGGSSSRGSTGMTPPAAPRPMGSGAMMAQGSGSSKSPRPTGPMGTGPSMMGSGSPVVQEGMLADQCLVRFLDLNVEPGHLYEYQIQIKMTNPAYKKPELAISEEVTKEQYILGEFKAVTTKVEDKDVPLQVRVPAETYYYAMDDKAAVANPDKAPVQVQRWLESVQVNDTDYPVGEWSILEKDMVGRGEDVGKVADVEVPWWDPKVGGFTMINSNKGAAKKSGAAAPPAAKVPVNFDTEVMLVDFEGGKRSYSLTGGGQSKAGSDESPIEMLLLTPDGKLIVHNSHADTEDQDRTKRLDAWKARLDQVKNPQPDAGTPGAPGGPTPGGSGTMPKPSIFDKP